MVSNAKREVGGGGNGGGRKYAKHTSFNTEVEEYLCHTPAFNQELDDPLYPK